MYFVLKEWAENLLKFSYYVVHREHGEDNSQITVGVHIVLKMLNMS